jgi:hypothetical protein
VTLNLLLTNETSVEVDLKFKMTYWVCVAKLLVAKSNLVFSTPVTGKLNMTIYSEKHFVQRTFQLDTYALRKKIRIFISSNSYLDHNNKFVNYGSRN